MKKAIMIVLILTMALNLCACGQVSKEGGTTVPVTTEPAADTTPVETTAPATEPAANDSFLFTYNGVEIAMNAPAAEIITALGEPKSYTEEPSCAFVGMDKTYFYGSFYLQTYPMEDQDYIYCLWIVDDSVTTPEGIYIGATQAQVEAAYGADSYNGSNAYVIIDENTRFTVILDNGVVSSIQYDAVV